MKPKIYNVGPVENNPDLGNLPDNCLWVVYYYYTYDEYNGNGEAYCFDGEKYYEKNLGHCSCYGAWDLENDWSPITYSELMEMHLAGDREEDVKIRSVISDLVK